ncbi:MAG TPA: glycine cleavage T C-terminal barrel domain-containing protein [Acidimicrobiales bacterium]|nr:glycine cleavage T C-terminal barrel domain-containing protein [Acidimicrobiales bacterium]
MPLSFDETYAALHDAAVGRVVERDVVAVSGPDALTYLQGQCTQDLSSMAGGDARRSLLLTPQGKVVALVRVVASDSSRFLVEVEHGWGEQVLERLRRFKLRVKADLELVSWKSAEVRGPLSQRAIEGWRHEEGGGGSPGGGRTSLDEDLAVLVERFVVLVDDRFGRGVDVLAPDVALPPGVPEGDPAAFEAARIEAGLPAMGSELDDNVIPQEAGIVGETVSFTKGCYTGQELVARLDARGNRVPRVLRGIVVPGYGAGTLGSPALPPVGSELRAGERVVGTLTSVGWSPRLGGAVALAYVRREVEPPAEVRLLPPASSAGRDGAASAGAGEPAGLTAEVRALPI